MRLTGFEKAECVLFERNNEKDTGDQKGLAGYSPILLTVLEHTLGYLPAFSAVKLWLCDLVLANKVWEEMKHCHF